MDDKQNGQFWCKEKELPTGGEFEIESGRLQSAQMDNKIIETYRYWNLEQNTHVLEGGTQLVGQHR